MEGMVARMASQLGVTLAKLVWVDKHGVHEQQFLRHVEAAGFEMHYKQDNQQVYQALGEQVVAAVKGGYDETYVATASGGVPHALWKEMGHVHVINSPPSRCVHAHRNIV
jgi:hypothetical protein